MGMIDVDPWKRVVQVINIQDDIVFYMSYQFPTLLVQDEM